MSIQTELERILTARDALRAKAVELKISAGTEKLDELVEDFNSLEYQGSISAQVKEGETYTIPKGVHDGTGTVSGVSGGGSYNLQSKTVTPTKKPQQVTPDEGYYGLSDVMVNAIPANFQDTSSVTATADDVLATKVIVTSDGAVTTGTMPNNGNVEKVLDTTTTTYTVPQGFHGGTGRVSIVPEEKSVTPTTSEQTVTPTAGKVLSRVTVAKIPENYVDTTDADAVAGDILIGKSAYVNGIKTTGTMPDNGDVSQTIDGLVTSSVTISAGYTRGGTISLDRSIEEALAAI